MMKSSLIFLCVFFIAVLGTSAEDRTCYVCGGKDEEWCNDPEEVKSRGKQEKCKPEEQNCIESFAIVMGAEATSRSCTSTISEVHCWDNNDDGVISKGCVCNTTLCNGNDYRQGSPTTPTSAAFNTKINAQIFIVINFVISTVLVYQTLIQYL